MDRWGYASLGTVYSHWFAKPNRNPSSTPRRSNRRHGQATTARRNTGRDKQCRTGSDLAHQQRRKDHERSHGRQHHTIKTAQAWGDVKPGASSDFTKFGGYALAQLLEAQILLQDNVTILVWNQSYEAANGCNRKRVWGSRADNQGRLTINAKSVILCTGGYEHNKEMMVKYCGPHADDIVPYGWGAANLAAGGNVSTTSTATRASLWIR